MTAEEVAKVLARVQLGDNRQVDRAVFQAWFREIGDLDYRDAIEAVEMHRRETPDWLMAAHVRSNVRRVVRERERVERIREQFARLALPAPQITLDRAEFDRITEENKAFWRAERARKAAEQ